MSSSNNNKKTLERWKIIALSLMLYDALAIVGGYFAALWIRFDCKFSKIELHYVDAYISFIPVYVVAGILVFLVFKLYKSVWRFAGFSELMRSILANIVLAIIYTVGITVLFERMPISYYMMGVCFQMALTTGARFAYRVLLADIQRRENDENALHRVMIIGAGAAGQIILKEIRNSKETRAKVCCIIDDNPNKWDRYLDGVPIVGGRDDILLNVHKYNIDQIFLAIPSSNAEDKRDIINICKATECEIKSLPGIYQFVNGEITINSMRDVAVEELLGRDTIKVNMEEIFDYIEDKVIMVTGGGGSIGSELCRQIAKHNPKQLIIVDIYENNVYEIEQELKSTCPQLNLLVLIASVRDAKRINSIFEKYRPDIVYHAAAHKHVPLMETSPCEAIKNNAIGTYKTACAALKYGTKKFVLVSTDKAVNPTNIMGASKRICEMIVQTMDMISKSGKTTILPDLSMTRVDGDVGTVAKGQRTDFVAVRFGNVLGSNGSVIPLFKKQIEKGGPVTVTHPDIIRYFMTIPEAVSLILQAGVYAKGGEIFVLNMGAPVKIDTLARNLIKLSGYKPDEDIKIVYTGLRPGEKLYEEKLMAEEGMKTTPNKMIHIGRPIQFDTDVFLKNMKSLAEACYDNDEHISDIVEMMVPTYHPENAATGKGGKTFEKLLNEAENTEKSEE